MGLGTFPPRELLLDYERRGARISLVERLRGQSGWLCADQLTVTSLDTEQTMLLADVIDDGDFLDRETCEKLLTVPAQDEIDQKKDELIAEVESRLRQETSRETLFTVRWRIQWTIGPGRLIGRGSKLGPDVPIRLNHQMNQPPD